MRRWVLVAGAAAGVGTLLAFAGRWWWCFELLTHFRPHYAVALAASMIACLTLKRWWIVAVLGVGLAYNVALILPLYLPPVSSSAGGKPIRLLLANLHVHNRQHQRFLQLVAESSPDILVALEVNTAWLGALDQLAATFPHRVHHAREDSFGVAVLSRLPAELLEIRWIGQAEVPSALAKFALGERGEFYLIATHPLPPTSAENAAERNEQLQAVAKVAATLDTPTILAGDLNTTSWSPFFRDLLAASGLRDSRPGWGIQPTWPGPLAWLGVPIDHVLVSPGVEITRRQVGPHIGSDHRPVLIELVVPPATRRSAATSHTDG